jgi:flagellar hook assembly protein FlgD
MKSGCVSIQEKSLINSFHSFPNPFVAGKESAHIEFYLETKSEITMRIYTMDGRPVKEILNKVIREQGLYYNDLWDGKNEVGQIVRSGIYMCVLEVKSLTDGKTIKLKNKIAVIR